MTALVASCKTAELNALTKKVEALEKENKVLETKLEAQMSIADEAAAKANSALEQVEQHSQIAAQMAAESMQHKMEAEQFQKESIRQKKLYEECAQKKGN